MATLNATDWLYSISKQMQPYNTILLQHHLPLVLSAFTLEQEGVYMIRREQPKMHSIRSNTGAWISLYHSS